MGFHKLQTLRMLGNFHDENETCICEQEIT